MPARSHRQQPLPDSRAIRWSDFPRVYWIAIGVAILLGMLSGAVWIGWNLLKLHVLQ